MLRIAIWMLLIFSMAGFEAAAVQVIKLSQPNYQGKVSLEESILHRRSERDFLPDSLSKDQLSQLLWAGQGITDPDFNFRSAPSCGSLYPLVLYAIKSDGVFKYVPEGHKLEKLSSGDKRPSMVRLALGQQFIGDAPVVFMISGIFDKTRSQYGMRGDRFVFMEAGHAAENICLQATAMGLGAITVGSFWDNAASAALELPPQEDPLYLIAVGHKRQ